ncbi:hypothetical protein N431DRAFT_93626 [Stipitochalara longipes BDJ]|nr:hypothetical protein N431DRAFT_93626 [Stipitochalara longipes BDJ]
MTVGPSTFRRVRGAHRNSNTQSIQPQFSSLPLREPQSRESSPSSVTSAIHLEVTEVPTRPCKVSSGNTRVSLYSLRRGAVSARVSQPMRVPNAPSLLSAGTAEVEPPVAPQRLTGRHQQTLLGTVTLKSRISKGTATYAFQDERAEARPPFTGDTIPRPHTRSLLP